VIALGIAPILLLGIAVMPMGMAALPLLVVGMI
jgi:hypothetical protein